MLAGLLVSNSDNEKQLAAGLRRGPTSQEALFRDDVEYLRRQNGLAICDDVLICFRAGKPFVFDAFNAAQAEFVGKLDPAEVARMTDGRNVKVIELDFVDMVRLSAGLPPPTPFERWEGSTDTFLQNVDRNYFLDRRTGDRGFFVAKDR